MFFIVKLIVELWDVGYGGYEVGDFLIGWSEWNGCYCDIVRDFWCGVEGTLFDFAIRIVGSVDFYGDDGCCLIVLINFVIVYDGFTFVDFVSYDCKHNEVNGEGNCDGFDDNCSWNCGVEGFMDDLVILVLCVC